jgi:hypothetical protein
VVQDAGYIALENPVELPDWVRKKYEGESEAWLYFFKRGWVKGLLEGQQRVFIIYHLLENRVGTVDKELSSIVPSLAQIWGDEMVNLLLTSSREELLARFGQNTLH